MYIFHITFHFRPQNECVRRDSSDKSTGCRTRARAKDADGPRPSDSRHRVPSMKCAVLVVVVVLELFPGNFLAVLPGTGDGEWPRKEVRSYLATSTINSFTPGSGDTVPDTVNTCSAIISCFAHSLMLYFYTNSVSCQSGNLECNIR